MDLSKKNTDYAKTTLFNLITNSNAKSHSFILSGAKGAGKSGAIKLLAQELLKTAELNTHPNILWINDAQKNINVAEIRSISNFMYRTTYHASLPKLIVIDCVNNLNLHSFNALLKILEEPTKNTYFILIANNLGILPDTIKSRSIVIKFPPQNPSTIHQQIKQQFPSLSDAKLNGYLSITSTSGTIAELINNSTIETYKQLLELLQTKGRTPTSLYKFIEENFATLEQLEIFHILIKNLIHKALKIKTSSPITMIPEENKTIRALATKNLLSLLSIDRALDSFVANSKTLGLDIKTVVLVMINKIKTLTA